VIDGEYVYNTAFSRSYMNAQAAIYGVLMNNRAASPDGGKYARCVQRRQPGLAWPRHRRQQEIKHLWDGTVHAGYKYLESDATIDAFADSDFGLGGTNLKGYFVGGNYRPRRECLGDLRWMSANNIAGSPYASMSCKSTQRQVLNMRIALVLMMAVIGH